MAKKPSPQGNFAPAKKAAWKVVDQVPEVAVPEAAPPAVEPAAETAAVPTGPKPKKARYVRAAKGEMAPPATPLPVPSRTAPGKMMSRGVKPTPRKPPVSGAKDAKGPPERKQGPTRPGR